MDLTPYVDSLRHQLAVAADAGGADARALADRLTAPLDAAVRLTLLEALSSAADEITRDLAPGSVDVRLRGGNPDFVVTPPPAEPLVHDEPAPTIEPAADGSTARINLRLPESLKTRADEAAAREGLSVNAWLVRAVAGALESPGGSREARDRDAVRGGRRYTGWVR